MSSFDPSHLCSPGWTVQSRNASWFRMKLGGWLYCSQNQNIRVLSMFFSHPTKERGRKSNRGCTPQIGGAYFLKVKVLVAQSCLTLFDPMDCSLPGSSLHGILQARILDWGAIFTSRGSSQPRDWTQVSCIAGRFFIIWATDGKLFVRWIYLLLIEEAHNLSSFGHNQWFLC